MPDLLKDRIDAVHERLHDAVVRSGRSPEDVTLVAVSKTHPPETVREAYECGLRVFGENRVDEAVQKIDTLSGLDITWHMIGQVQSRKAKDIPGRFALLHSLDRLKLAHGLERQAKEKSIGRLRCLVEVNVTEDSARGGVHGNKMSELLDFVSQSNHLSVEGLMLLPPWSEKPEAARPFFVTLRELFEKLKAEMRPHVEMKHLSMGMTSDFAIAIEEGSTMVRVGRAIFGERRH